jgi:hypothetical protein
VNASNENENSDDPIRASHEFNSNEVGESDLQNERWFDERVTIEVAIVMFDEFGSSGFYSGSPSGSSIFHAWSRTWVLACSQARVRNCTASFIVSWRQTQSVVCMRNSLRAAAFSVPKTAQGRG